MYSHKRLIQQQFDKHALHYQHYSELQKLTAQTLADQIQNLIPAIPDGSILEIGAGIGGLTKHLIQAFQQREFIITDISPNMLLHCQQNCSNVPTSNSLQFIAMDGELPTVNGSFASIISGMAFQWFEDIQQGIQRLYEKLLPGGILFFSFPEEQSFPEWKQLCNKENVPYTGHPLPNEEFVATTLSQLGHHWQMHFKDIPCTYSKPLDFFERLIKIGAGYSENSQKMNLEQKKKLLKAWKKQPEVIVTYRIGYAWIQKK